MAKKPISFVIKSLSTREFATIESAYKKDSKVGISTKFIFGSVIKNNIIGVALELTFKCDKIPFVILKTQMTFDVMPKDFNNFLNKKTKMVTIPKDFLTHIAAMTVSASRGILHAKLEGSDFDFLLLPALNVSDILKEDLKLEGTGN